MRTARAEVEEIASPVTAIPTAMPSHHKWSDVSVKSESPTGRVDPATSAHSAIPLATPIWRLVEMTAAAAPARSCGILPSAVSMIGALTIAEGDSRDREDHEPIDTINRLRQQAARITFLRGVVATGDRVPSRGRRHRRCGSASIRGSVLAGTGADQRARRCDSTLVPLKSTGGQPNW